MFLFLMAQVSGAAAEDGKKLFTAYNMWFESPNEMLCINFKVGEMIPAGTEVEAKLTIFDFDQPQSADNVTKISFKRVSDGKVFEVRFEPRYHPDKTIKDYYEHMFTIKPFEEFTSGMSPQEVYAIRRGFLIPGMSKAAVLVSYGPPPEHFTPSLEKDVWYYWTQRNLRKEIYFDNQGRTLDVL
jgi:hypothetical protein